MTTDPDPTHQGRSAGQDHPTVRQLATRIVYQNRWMTVREDQVIRADGSTGVYGFVEKPDFALIIPLDGDGFHLVEQYRYPAGARSWEFPQGTFPDQRDGSPLDLARAELGEETGLHAGDLVHLGRLLPAPGTSRQGMNVFLATDLVPGPTERESEEQDMRQRWVSREEFAAMLHDGTVIDAGTVAAYTLLLLHEEAARAPRPRE